MAPRDCTFYIVRHGQAELNRDKIVMGQLDSPLTQMGKAEAAQLREDLSDIHFDAVYASDLQRAVDTARIIVGSGVNIRTEAKLRERSFGRLEGRPVVQLQQLRDKVANNINSKAVWKHKLVPDAESNAEVFDRVYGFLKSVAQKNEGRNILVVTHSGPIRTFLIGLGLSDDTGLTPSLFRHGHYLVVTIGSDSAQLQGIYPNESESHSLTTE